MTTHHENTKPPLFASPAHAVAALSMVMLLVLCVVWELWGAPLRAGGSWWVLKIVPLLFCLRGVLRGNHYTLQWSSMLVLLYMAEGVVRGMGSVGASGVLPSDHTAWYAWAEFALSWMFFFGAILHLRPFKIEAKKIKKD